MVVLPLVIIALVFGFISSFSSFFLFFVSHRSSAVKSFFVILLQERMGWEGWDA